MVIATRARACLLYEGATGSGIEWIDGAIELISLNEHKRFDVFQLRG